MLTGKTRHRIGFKGKLVLQVEEKLSMPLVWGIGGDSQTWRDATIEDLQELVGTIMDGGAKNYPIGQNPPPTSPKPPPPPPPNPPPYSRTLDVTVLPGEGYNPISNGPLPPPPKPKL